MSVWKRVRKYASESATSIIHGKAEHEETKATSSRALGDGSGALCGRSNPRRYRLRLRLYQAGRRQTRVPRQSSKARISPGFNPDVHLQTVGVANQTTMLRGGNRGSAAARSASHFSIEMGLNWQRKIFRFFRHNLRRNPGAAGCVARITGRTNGSAAGRGWLQTAQIHRTWPRWAKKNCPPISCSMLRGWFPPLRSSIYNLHEKTRGRFRIFWLPNGPAVIGITAGASCPNNLIEETLIRLFELRGIFAPRARTGSVTTTNRPSFAVIGSASREWSGWGKPRHIDGKAEG